MPEQLKSELPVHVVPRQQKKRAYPIYTLCAIILICIVRILPSVTSSVFETFADPIDDPHNPDSLCPLVEKFDPTQYLYSKDTLDTILHDAHFRNQSVAKWLDSVKVPTQVYDDFVNPNQADSLEELYKLEPRWKPFEKFHSFLESTFPLVHKHLKLDKVNKFALVYTWQGSNSTLKPIMLTAHYDVVPVQAETVDQWTFPPFEGGLDGEKVYGRGVSDCKNLLIGLLETAELLLSEGKFKPQRTIIFAFGYDEESVGTGADAISKHLLAKYGRDSIYQIIDEGNEGFQEIEGTKFILPATGEKGHVDSEISLFTPGGHSSIPPDHTGIGLLSKLISLIEDATFDSALTNVNPVLNQMQCLAEHSTSIDKSLKKDILRSHLDVTANKRVIDYLSKDLESKYRITTSQAADIIQGGVKSNALPEHVSVLINHRVAVEESVESVGNKVLLQIKEFAKKYDLGLIFEGKEIFKPTKKGHFVYNLVNRLEPAPLTPTNDKIWNTFGGSLRYLYEELVFPEENNTYIFAPFISTGNTDTKSYWDLTRNIFRYQPSLPNETSKIHSVDENAFVDGHLSIIAFYYYYLQVVDQFSDDPLTT